MIPKIQERSRAIDLRKQGFTYSEILKEVPVAKSSLALWLKEVGLSKPQKQRITEKRKRAMERGWAKWHQMRLDRTRILVEGAREEIKKISLRELWLMGIMLYWAEGSKEKEYGGGQTMKFSNSDPVMILLFLRWLKRCIGIETQGLVYEIYLHETSRDRVDDVVKKWSEIVSMPTDIFRVYFKKGNIKTKRRNIGENYFGVARICVPLRNSSHQYF